MKKCYFLLAGLIASFFAITANAAITVTPGSSGSNICPGLAAGGATPAFTTLGAIVIAEGVASDITTGTHLLTLTPPAGWTFNNAATPMITFLAGRNILVTPTVTLFTSSSLTISVTTTAATQLDMITISGLQVQASSPLISGTANVTASSATGFNGIVVNTTSFAALGLLAVPVNVIPVTTSTLCLGDSAAFTAGASSPAIELLHQDFNSGLGTWNITNITGIAASYWQLTTPPGHLSTVPGDGSTYLEASPDATNSNLLPTNTIVTSPSFSTVGYTSATLTFNEYYVWYAQDTTASVQYSIDGGTTWTTLTDNFITGSPLIPTIGTTTWVSATPTATLPLPADAIGVPDVMLRWNYNSDWGWYWAIDNISVNGTPGFSFSWVDPSSGTTAGITCATCTTATITPSVAGSDVYSVSTTVNGCTFSGGTTITVIAPPNQYTVMGGGPYCAGGMGSDVILSGSDFGINYQLYMGPSAVGAIMAGLGSILDFGSQTVTGTYSVVATDAAAGCMSNMLGSVDVSIIPLPVISAITGDPTVCMFDTKSLADLTPGGVWSTDDPTIASVDASGAISGVAIGNTTVNYAVTELGCTDSAMFSIAVGNPMAAAAVSPVTASICHGNPVNLTSSASGVTLQWTRNGNAIPGATDATYTTDSSGAFSFIMDNGTCTQNGPTATVAPSPDPVITFNTSGNYLYTGSFITYQWLDNGAAIPGATNSIYPLTTSGSFQVAVKDAFGCIDTSGIYNYTSTGVVTITAAQISVYPNPAATLLHIDAPCKVNVAILSPDGRTVMAQNDGATLNIEQLANGVYVILVYDENNFLLKTGKFSKIN